MPINSKVCRLFLPIIFAGWMVPLPAFSQKLKSFEQDLTRIYAQSRGFAVTISVTSVPSGRSSYFSSSDDRNHQSTIGSGFIFDSLGHIVTTASMTDQGNFYKITFFDGTTRFADLVGTDKASNISVLKVNAPPFPPPFFGNSDLLTPGTWIGLIGNAFGIFPSFTYGIASGRNARGEILVTAEMSPGSAGGLIVNSDGFAVGMLSSKLTEPVQLNGGHPENGRPGASRSQTPPEDEVDLPIGGLSLVIPSNRILATARDIINGKFDAGAFLGVFPKDLDLNWAKRVFNINYGVFITDVLRNSPAYLAGIREGDILLEFGGRRLMNSDQVRRILAKSSPGAAIDLTILRAGKIKKLKTTLGHPKDYPDAGSQVNRPSPEEQKYPGRDRQETIRTAGGASISNSR